MAKSAIIISIYSWAILLVLIILLGYISRLLNTPILLIISGIIAVAVWSMATYLLAKYMVNRSRAFNRT